MKDIPLAGKQYNIYGMYVVVLPERDVYSANGQKLGKISSKLDLNNGKTAQMEIAAELKKAD